MGRSTVYLWDIECMLEWLNCKKVCLGDRNLKYHSLYHNYQFENLVLFLEGKMIGDHQLGKIFVELFQTCPTGHLWHAPVFWFQKGWSSPHWEHDFVSEFQIGLSGGHRETWDPESGWGLVIFSHLIAIGFSCCPGAHCITHYPRVGSYFEFPGQTSHLLVVIL